MSEEVNVFDENESIVDKNGKSNNSAKKEPLILKKFINILVGASKIIVNKVNIAYKKTYNKTLCAYVYLKNKVMKREIIKNKRYLLMSGIFLLVVAIILILMLVSHHNSDIKDGPTVAGNLIKINKVEDSVRDIEQNIENKSKITSSEELTIEDKLEKLNQKLALISKNSGHYNSLEINNLRATLVSDKVSLSQKLNALNKEIGQIKKKVFPPSTLSANALPFTVISVDPWNGIPYAETEPKNHSDMVGYVGLYQIRSGWKAINMSSINQTVTFVNSNGQVVHIKVKTF